MKPNSLVILLLALTFNPSVSYCQTSTVMEDIEFQAKQKHDKDFYRLKRESRIDLLDAKRKELVPRDHNNNSISKISADILVLANMYLGVNAKEDAEELFQLVANDSNTKPSHRGDAFSRLGQITFSKRGQKGLPAARAFLEQALFHYPADSKKYAETLSTIGSYSLYMDDKKKMKASYKTLLELPENIKKEIPSELVSCCINLIRHLPEKEVSEKDSEKYRETILSNLKKHHQHFGPDTVLAYSLEAVSYRRPWDSPKRRKALQKFYEDKNHVGQPEALRIGNELFWIKFSKRNKQWETFESFAGSYLKRLREFKLAKPRPDSHDPTSLTPEQEHRIQNYKYHCIAAFASAIHHRNPTDKRIKKLSKEFIDNSLSMNSLKGCYPAGMKQQQIQDAYDSVQHGTYKVFKMRRPDSK